MVLLLLHCTQVHFGQGGIKMRALFGVGGGSQWVNFWGSLRCLLCYRSSTTSKTPCPNFGTALLSRGSGSCKQLPFREAQNAAFAELASPLLPPTVGKSLGMQQFLCWSQSIHACIAQKFLLVNNRRGERGGGGGGELFSGPVALCPTATEFSRIYAATSSAKLTSRKDFPPRKKIQQGVSQKLKRGQKDLSPPVSFDLIRSSLLRV